MNSTFPQYHSSDIAVIIPTKDRPEKLHNLLASMTCQSVQCGRIIIIDGGKNAKNVVSDFSTDLAIEYHRCSPPGQIRQRNMAISLLTSKTPLICLFDDDIVLCDRAIETMLTFWNHHPAETAGVSFNVINNKPDRFTRLLQLLTGNRIQRGRVFKSGMTTSNCQVQKDLRVQWLCGGATVWRQAILRTFSHKEIPSRWAINEDLIFSYPVGKKFPLYVCAAAQVRHEHVLDYSTGDQFQFKGLYEIMWRIYFVRKNRDLSINLFLIWLLVMVLGNVFLGIFTGDYHHIKYARGQVEGAIKMLKAGSGINNMISTFIDTP